MNIEEIMDTARKFRIRFWISIKSETEDGLITANVKDLAKNTEIKSILNKNMVVKLIKDKLKGDVK